MSHLIRLTLVIGSLLSAASTASAQPPYPDKPIHLIVAFVPGGATDTLARQLQNDLQAALGQPMVIENRPAPAAAWRGAMSLRPSRTATR
jgi:tripartite-type tricarboxylate transporter receptor subunit TctC